MAAMFHWTLAARTTLNQSSNSSGAVLLRELGSVVVGPGLDVVADADGACVRVPAAGLVVVPAAELDTAMILEHSVPELAELVRAAPTNLGVLCVRETSFSHGDPVKLSAHVVEEATIVGAGYRSDVGKLWVAQSSAILEEIVDDPRW
jgi:hypothetical protein